jgi:hypothetical protein
MMNEDVLMLLTVLLAAALTVSIVGLIAADYSARRRVRRHTPIRQGGADDLHHADDVAVTITADRVWIDVNGANVFRAYRIGRLQVDDRR